MYLGEMEGIGFRKENRRVIIADIVGMERLQIVKLQSLHLFLNRHFTEVTKCGTIKHGFND